MPTRDYVDSIKRWSAQYGADPALVEAVMNHESGGNPRARGAAGEIGLMQLLPGANGGIGWWESNGNPRLDYAEPDNNIRVGCWLLGKGVPAAVRQNGLPVTPDNIVWAYNAGPGNQKRGVLPSITKAYQDDVRKRLASGAWASMAGGGSITVGGITLTPASAPAPAPVSKPGPVGVPPVRPDATAVNGASNAARLEEVRNADAHPPAPAPLPWWMRAAAACSALVALAEVVRLAMGERK